MNFGMKKEMLTKYTEMSNQLVLCRRNLLSNYTGSRIWKQNPFNGHFKQQINYTNAQMSEMR